MQMFPTRDPQKSARLMSAMDSLQGRFGRGIVRPAVTGVERRWTTKVEYLSRRYTTRVKELSQCAPEHSRVSYRPHTRKIKHFLAEIARRAH